MNYKSTIARWVPPALLPAALVGFLLLPVSAEMPVSNQSGVLETPSEYLAYENAAGEAANSDHDVYSVTHSSATVPYDEYEDYEDDAVEVVILSQDELAELIGPIALYPDDLLAIVLPAATYPLEIVQAARFLDDYEKNRSLKPSGDWDESVTALLNYPEVVQMLNDDIDWTWKLGGAVLNQQQDVIAAVESFRDRAYAAGNLKSDDYQTVSQVGDNIEITPTREEVIYVPYYEPRRVVIRQVEPVYYYYPRPYPVYYYPYPDDYYFSSGFFWGVTTAFRIGWSSHHLHVHHYSFRSHPYYGYRYSNYYYRRPSVTVYNNYYVNGSRRPSPYRYRDGDYWRPRPASGVRPGGHGTRRPVHRNENGRDQSSGRHSALLASQSSSTRPVTRTTDRGNVAPADRNIRNARPEHKPGTVRRPDNTTRLRDRSDAITVAVNEPVRNRRGTASEQRDRKPATTDNGIRFRDRPETARVFGDVETPDRRGTVRQQRESKPGASRQADNTIRFRDRPDTVRASTDRQTPDRRGTVREQRDSKPNATRKPDNGIRFRDRSKPVTVATRPAPVTTAQRPRNATQSRPQQSNTTAVRPTPVQRDTREPARRNTDRQRVVSQRPVATKPAATRRAPVVRNETNRQAPVQSQPNRRRAQADHDAKPQRKRETAPDRKESHAKNQKEPVAERQKKRRR